MMKGPILQEDITIFHLYRPNNSMSKYMRTKLIKLQGEIGEFLIIMKDLNTSLPRSSKQKISEDIFELSSTINQLNTTADIYRWFLPTENTQVFFFVCLFLKLTWIFYQVGPHPGIQNTLTHLNQFTVALEHNEIKWETYNKENWKVSKYMEINKNLNSRIKEEIIILVQIVWTNIFWILSALKW